MDKKAQRVHKLFDTSNQEHAQDKYFLESGDKIRMGRMNNTIHTIQTANKVVKQNQDLLESALAGTDAITAVVNKMKEVAVEAQDDQLTASQRQALVDEYNELSDEFLINESYILGEWDYQ